MSFEAMKWAILIEAPSPSAGHVLIVLADFANDKGYRCWPSHQTLANLTGLSVRAVGTHVRALEVAGLVGVTKRRGGSSVYTLNVRGDICRPTSAPTAEVVSLRPRQDLPNPRQDLPEGSAGFADKPIKNQSRTNHVGARAKAKQFPNGFSFADVRQWTITNKLPANVEDFEQFKDHHLAKGSTFKDWQAAWRTWARNAKKWDRSASDTSDSYSNAQYGVGL